MEEEKSVGNNEVVDKNTVEPNKSDVTGALEEADRENEELIEALVGNSGFNDSFLTMQSGKMECEAYYSLPVEPIRKAMFKKMITKKEDMGDIFVIPCNVGGLKYVDALFDQGSDVKVMPLSTYNRLTNENLVETDIRLSLSSQSHIYPLGIAEDVLVEATGFMYPVDFIILDIKEGRKRPFILRTPFLTTARAEIRFDKGIINLRSGK
ncbi:reverse transcriptase domain-containing protein, partial [Tanacetum coccineum]